MTTYDLVFEGGGAKGIAFAGAVRALEQSEVKFGRLLGTSAGAVTAILLSVGYSSADILAALTEQDDTGQNRFSTFADVPTEFKDESIAASRIAALLKAVDVPFVPEALEQRTDRALIQALLTLPLYRQLFSFVELGGLYAGDAFSVWLYERLNAMDTLGAATLANLYEHTGLELTMTAADVTERQLLILNHRTAPNLPAVWAVRMSMSIPFYWQEVTWRSEWGRYRGLDLSGHKVVDGGVLSGFPIELLLSADPYVTDVMGQPQGEVLGFLLDEERPVSRRFKPPAPRQASSLKTVQRALDIVNTMMSAHDKLALEAFSDRVVRLPTQGYGAFEFNMSAERLDLLTEAAYNTTLEALNDFDPQTRSAKRNIPTPMTAIDSVACKLLRRDRMEQPHIAEKPPAQ